MNVTDGDRERARGIVANWSVNFGPDELDPLRAMIETYLADERERALKPFIKLARRYGEEGADSMRMGAGVYSRIAREIRSAAEETE